MSDGVLSQEEIDALLRSNAVVDTAGEQQGQFANQSGVNQANNTDISPMEKDAIGEVANMVMGSASTALSTLLGKRVEITTPVVELTDPEKFRQEYPKNCLLVYVEYVTGLSGANVLVIKDTDAGVMVDLMLGGDGQSPPTELNEMHISAVSEAMNQMMGAASTALSTIINDRVEISPPVVETVDLSSEGLKGVLGEEGQLLAKVSFRMTIENLIDSEIIQLMPLQMAKSMVGSLMQEMSSAQPEEPVQSVNNVSIPEQNPVVETKQQVAAAAEPIGLVHPEPQTFNTGSQQPASDATLTGVRREVPVQPVQFAPIQSSFTPQEMSNIDLLMDVPLQITVELGRSKKTIREILALGQGSVIELDKLAGEPVDLLVNGKLLAKGEVVVIDENFGIRVTDIISPIERVTSLQ